MLARECHARCGAVSLGNKFFDRAAIAAKRGVNRFHIGDESRNTNHLRPQRPAKAEIGGQYLARDSEIPPVPDIVIETFYESLAVRHAWFLWILFLRRVHTLSLWTGSPPPSLKLAAFACFPMSTGHAHALRRRSLAG